MKKSRYLILYCAVIAMLGLLNGLRGPTLPALAANTASTLKEFSYILSVAPLGYLVGSLLGGIIYDRRSTHLILAGAIFMAAVSLVFVPVIPSLWVMAPVVLILGFAAGTMDVGSNTLLMWTYGSEARPYLNGMHFMFGAGALTGPLMVAQSIRSTGGILWAHWVPALLLGLLLVATLKVPGPVNPRVAVERVKPRFRWKLVVPVFFTVLMYSGAENSFGTWVYKYSLAKGMLDITQAAMLTSVFWGSLAFGRLMGVPLSRRLSANAVMGINIVGVIAALSAINLYPDTINVLWAGAAASGFFMGSFFPTLISIAAPNLAEGGVVTGRVTSLFFIGGGTGVMIVPWIIGQGFEARGPNFAMQMIFGSLVLMSLCYYLFRLLCKKFQN